MLLIEQHETTLSGQHQLWQRHNEDGHDPKVALRIKRHSQTGHRQGSRGQVMMKWGADYGSDANMLQPGCHCMSPAKCHLCVVAWLQPNHESQRLETADSVGALRSLQGCTCPKQFYMET